MEFSFQNSQSYADLEIRILDKHAEGYPVELTFSGEQEFPRGYLPADIVPWIPSNSSSEDGKRLFNLLFADEQTKIAWAEVREQHPLRRIRLRIDATAPELHTLPWELLHDTIPGLTPPPVAADATTPFSRYLAGQWRPGSPVLTRPVKLLLALANPIDLDDYDLAFLDLDAERHSLESALADAGVAADTLEITVLEQPVTLSALETALRKGYHILHLVSHGVFYRNDDHPDREYTELFLADSENRVARVSEDQFADMLARLGESLRLVFLSGCQTATRSAADAFRGFAPKLIASGVPAVVAMQDLIPINTSLEFTSVFYRQLLRHGQVDLACNEARASLMTAQLPGAAIPVVFMRLRSGKLFGQRGQILGERASSFWSTLLNNIAEGECTPFLGPGVNEGMLPMPRELAQTLAHEHHYPFDPCDHWPHVAQFVGTLDNRRLRRDVVRLFIRGFQKRTGQKLNLQDQRKSLSEIIEASNWSELSRHLTENEIHHQLAELGLPLYITTNFDNFMTLALQATGKHARREAIAWRGTLRQEAGNPYYDLDPPATLDEPVVLHLYGTDQDLLSMVLTEDDYLDYLARISRDYEYLFPTSVNEALASTTLLFLGYRLEDLDLKILMRGLLTHLDLERWGMLHVAVQIEASEVDEAVQQEIIRYFQKYFGKSRIDVYWGSPRQFVADLHIRWKEYMEK